MFGRAFLHRDFADRVEVVVVVGQCREYIFRFPVFLCCLFGAEFLDDFGQDADGYFFGQFGSDIQSD